MKDKFIAMFALLVRVKDNIYQDYMADNLNQLGEPSPEQRIAYFTRNQGLELFIHTLYENGKITVLTVMTRQKYGIVKFHPDQFANFEVKGIHEKAVRFDDEFWVDLWLKSNPVSALHSNIVALDLEAGNEQTR